MTKKTKKTKKKKPITYLYYLIIHLVIYKHPNKVPSALDKQSSPKGGAKPHHGRFLHNQHVFVMCGTEGTEPLLEVWR